MTKLPIPNDPVAAACLGRDALDSAATQQAHEPDPDHGQFYEHGRELVAVLGALDHLADALSGQIARYGDQRLLRDDAGANPHDRLDSTGRHLADLRTALTAAADHANQYWSSIGHIGVDVDPHAPEQD